MSRRSVLWEYAMRLPFIDRQRARHTIGRKGIEPGIFVHETILQESDHRSHGRIYRGEYFLDNPSFLRTKL